jgi:hypothetical protein
MIGAKVDLDKAKKDGLCFKCGEKGHQARKCRQKDKNQGTKGRQVTVRIVRLNRTAIPEENTKTQSDGDEIGNDNLEKEQPAVLATLKGFDLKDYDTESSDQADEPEEPDSEEKRATEWKRLRIRQWCKNIRRIEKDQPVPKTPRLKHAETSIGDRAKEFEKTLVCPGRQRDEDDGLDGSIRGNSPAPGVQGKANPNDSFTARRICKKPADREDVKSVTTANFSLNPKGNPAWKRSAEDRKIDSVREYQDWYKKVKSQDEHCICMCFDWNQTCWASTEEAWETHIQHCTRCMLWMFVECPVSGHESQQKRQILTDIGTRRYVTTDGLGGEIKDRNGRSCCENHLCLHDFTVHGSTNVPWWTCLSNECPEHRSIKERSNIWPTIPKITIKNAQVCPCVRKGCKCTFEKQHPYHAALVSGRGCVQRACEIHPVEMEWSSKRWEEVLFHDTESQQEEEEWSAVLKDTDESEERPVIRRLEALEERCPQISVRVKVKKHQTKASSTAEQTSTTPTEDGAKGQTLKQRIQDPARSGPTTEHSLRTTSTKRT